MRQPGIVWPGVSRYQAGRPTRLLEFAMPVALVIVLLDITLIYHASKTGRLQPWAFIILMVPLIGALAYIAVELIPEWLSGPGAQQARKRVASKLDPEKQYRELSDRLAGADTIANRAALAEECQKVGRFDEAEHHYDQILKLPMGEEPIYAFGKAQAQFDRGRPADALATLDELQKRWPDFQSAEGHLLYARALTEAGRVDEALEEYPALIAYSPGAEARVRYCCGWSAGRRRPRSFSTNCCCRCDVRRNMCVRSRPNGWRLLKSSYPSEPATGRSFRPVSLAKSFP
jgi:hypothetical protein